MTETETIPSLGQQIRTARKKAELTVVEVGFRVRMGEGAIRKIESGDNDNPKIKTLRAICGAVGLKAVKLVSAKGGELAIEFVAADDLDNSVSRNRH